MVAVLETLACVPAVLVLARSAGPQGSDPGAALFLFGLSGRGPDLSRVQAIVEEEVGVEVVGVDTTGPADSVTVTVRTEGSVSPEAVRAAGERVAEELRGLVLRVAVQQVMSTGG